MQHACSWNEIVVRQGAVRVGDHDLRFVRFEIEGQLGT
jgi:hypothetical protein